MGPKTSKRNATTAQELDVLRHDWDPEAELLQIVSVTGATVGRLDDQTFSS